MNALLPVDRVVEMALLPRQQLARAAERRAHAVPDAQVGPGEMTAPDVLRVKRRERIAAGEPQVGHVQREPQRARARATAHPCAGGSAAPGRARAGKSGGRSSRGPYRYSISAGSSSTMPALRVAPASAPSTPTSGEASAPRGVEQADRQRQVQRLGVHGREEEGHRRERRDHHRQASDVALAARCVVAGGAVADRRPSSDLPPVRAARASSSVVRRWMPYSASANATQREEHAAEHQRHADPCASARRPSGYSGKNASRERR